VEQHGKNPLQLVIAIIPARYASVRLEGKLLRPVAGKPLILHTLGQARKASGISRVIVATDDERIRRVVEENGDEVMMTSPAHRSGSDRIAEVARSLPENSIIVNVQGDEPLISPNTIDLAVEALLSEDSADMSTTCERIEDYRDVLSPDVVKVVTGENGNALYFSRSPAPFPREAVKAFGSLENALREDASLLSLFRKHTGLYVFRREFLLKFTAMAPTLLETTEMLEQLRALENGARIKVVETAESSVGVDNAEDLERVRDLLERPVGGAVVS
jgi:3-deoxy-manno-octulosonate cytidylyltransferase (CMP-KDO synthetase)